MVAIHTEKMLCVTGVYLGDIAYMIFVILHLNVSGLSVCSSCLSVCLFVCLFRLVGGGG